MAGIWKSTKEFFHEGILKQIRDSKKLHKLVDTTDFGLPVHAWKSTGSVFFSIIVASLIINLLGLAFPLALLQIYDRIIPNIAINTLVLLAAGVGFAILLEALLKITRTYVGAWADAKFEHIVGCNAFSRLIHAALPVVESEGMGVHIKRLNAINTLRDFYAGQAIVSLVDLPFIFVLLALIFYIAGILVLVPIGMLSILLFLASKNSHRLRTILDSRQNKDDRRFNYIIETLTNIHTVKSVSMEAQMQRRYERLQRTSSANDFDVSMESAKATGMGMSLSQLTLVAVVAFGSLLVINGQLTIGGLAACTLLSGRCLQPVNVMVGLWARLQSIKIAREDLNTLLRMPLEEEPGLPDMPKLKGKVELQNVSFKYPDSENKILEKVNLKLEPNEIIALSGEGLSGKSTLMELILGILKPDTGKILLDGNDISEFNAESYRQQIAYLPQNPKLFNGTILENLTLFREEQYYNEAILASRAAGLHTIVEQLPKGYDTLVANQAIDSLPRGTTQRIAMARVLLTKPALLIFDEANTSVDMQGDAIIRRMLERIESKCSMIIISHRPSILQLAKRKFQLANHTIEEIQ